MLRMRSASILVSDDDRAIDFYQEKLGFKLIVNQRTPEGITFLMFQPPGGGANLVVSLPIPGRPGTPGGFSNIFWETDDVEQLHQELAAKGVEFIQPPVKRHWGGVEAIFTDPDGNQFLLQQGGMPK